jgi:hypothetical protein
MSDEKTDNDTRYETKSIRVIRGAEARTLARWEKDGWQVVSQTQKSLHSEIVIRRPVPQRPWRLIAIGGGVLAVALSGVVVAGVLGERGQSEQSVSPDSSPAAAISPTTLPSPEGAPISTTEAEAGADAVLTAVDSAELAAVLDAGDSCSSEVQAFAASHAGDTISFEGSIAASNNHDGAATRYDLLISAGDSSEAQARGPAFQFRDVNTTYDLHYSGAVPDTIGVGTNLGITAEIVKYEPSSCLLLLEPVETTVR